MKSQNISYTGTEITDEETFKKLPEDLQHLLKVHNGFIAFDGGLHIRGVTDFPDWHSIQKVWFGDFALYKLFPSLNKNDIPFGQDCLGDQFILRDKRVWQLNAETDDLENLNLTLNEFLERAEENPVDFLSLEPLKKFIYEGGNLINGQLLNVYPPFCTEESANGISLKAVPMFERIGFLSDFAKQIKNL
ncbi:MAG TPA: SMI1/KNR4 family protein [Pyrinomonadaceae bacterium]|nr:SMI1/KNR4 family protein [Pyrinomonadaceae bacterium]